MIPEVGLHPAAQRELYEAAEASPSALGRVRKRIVGRFPSTVVYSVGDDGIFVSAVAHHSGRPFYWRGRV